MIHFIQTLTTPILIIFFLYFAGYGLMRLFPPRKLTRYVFWLSPIYAVVGISLFTVLTSLIGMPVHISAPILTLISVLVTLHFIFRKAYKPRFSLIRDGLLAVVVLASVFVHMSPVLLKHRTLTTVSLGNNDALVYASVPDYLQEHSIYESVIKDREVSYDALGIRNLLQTGYRWGSPALTAFFAAFTHLDGYQLAYVMQVVLFSVMLPLTYVLFVQLYGKESHLGEFLLLGLVGMNAHVLYMLYHNFFGQVMFWGVSLLFLILLLDHVQHSLRNDFTIARSEVMLGATLAALYYSYHEGVVFVVGPLLFVAIWSLLIRSSARAYWFSFIKIAAIAYLLSSIAMVHSIVFDIRQAGLVAGPIGWELFRPEVPYANPFEAFGMYSIHSFPPMPTFLAIALSLLILIIFVRGVKAMKYKVIIVPHLLVYGLFIYWAAGYHTNFFAYNRVLTYILPIITPIFVVGVLSALKKSRYKRYIVLMLVGATVYSGLLLNLKFIRNHIAADASLISLQELSQADVPTETIIMDDVFAGGMYWRQIWTEYFLYPKYQLVSPLNVNSFDESITDDSYVLLSKIGWYTPGKLVLQDVVWENDSYMLAQACISDECLIDSGHDLSQIDFGETLYDDSLVLDGWDMTEGEYRWANAQSSSVRLYDSEATQLSFTANTLAEPQNVDVSMNGLYIATVALSTEQDTYTFEIPQSDTMQTITFSFSHQYSPSKILGSPDMRSLRASFTDIELK